MKKIAGYLKDYWLRSEKRIFVLSALFMALAVFTNYYHGLNHRISTLGYYSKIASWFAVFLTAFSFPYALQAAWKKSNLFRQGGFWFLLFLAPALFAWKMAFTAHFSLASDAYTNTYWNSVADWPFKLLVFVFILLLVWIIMHRKQPFYGCGHRHFEPGPYLQMLLIMLPLIAAASTQKDFLIIYPKLKTIQYLLPAQGSAGYKLLYELSYGSDFLSVELFFRGFLVLAFARWAGEDAILPMACFYCTIHFGKPLGECISSFFGGLILGVVVFRTRVIWGGLIVHLGIAWLMELGGYLGGGLR